MSYIFQKLGEVSTLSEFPDGAKVLVEHNGDIKRCAADGLGGGGVTVVNFYYDIENQALTADKTVEEVVALRYETTLIGKLTASAQLEGTWMLVYGEIMGETSSIPAFFMGYPREPILFAFVYSEDGEWAIYGV